MKVKTFLGFVAIILAAVIVVVCGIGSSVNGEWFKNGNVYTWFNSWGQNSGVTEEPDKTGGLTVTQDNEVSSGISFQKSAIASTDFPVNGISETADSAVRITAVVYPLDAFDKSLDWGIGWADSNSEWANGKTVTDYVTVTPDSDGASSALLVCLQPFGERIRLRVSSRETVSNASAFCNINYRQKCIDITSNVNFNSSTNYNNFAYSTRIGLDITGGICPHKIGIENNTNTAYNVKDKFSYGLVLSEIYTLPFAYETVSFTYYVKLNPEFLIALRGSSSSTLQKSNYAEDWTLISSGSGTVASAINIDECVKGETEYSIPTYFKVLCDGVVSAAAPYIYYFGSALGDFIRIAKDFTETYHFEVKLVAEYGEECIEDITKIKFTSNSLTIPVSDVDLSDSDIEF